MINSLCAPFSQCDSWPSGLICCLRLYNTTWQLVGNLAEWVSYFTLATWLYFPDIPPRGQYTSQTITYIIIFGVEFPSSISLATFQTKSFAKITNFHLVLIMNRWQTFHWVGKDRCMYLNAIIPRHCWTMSLSLKILLFDWLKGYTGLP